MATGEHDGGDNDVQRSESLFVYVKQLLFSDLDRCFFLNNVCQAIKIAVCSAIGIAVCVCETIIVQRYGSLFFV